MLATLFNGEVTVADAPALFCAERGYHYGDGVFETMLLRGGRVRYLQDHWQRLWRGCERLQLPKPEPAVLHHELTQLTARHHSGVVKLVLSRGCGERGYRPPASATPTRLWQLFAAPATAVTSLRLRWCEQRLSRNVQLAGIKHCNRLEQVLAQAEWRDADIHDGLMLDTEGELVCVTTGNIFLVLDDTLVTPDLRYSGIAGVMRKQILRLAEQLGIAFEVRAVRAEEVSAAQEMFFTNAVHGIRPISQLQQQHWPLGALTRRLMTALEAEA